MPNKAAVELGKLGGRAGRGEAKRRGDSAYYSKLGKMRKIDTCCFCGHAVHGPGGCDLCKSQAGCNRPPY